MKETNIKKYGVDIPSKLPEIVNKIFKSKKKNGTLNSSLKEDKLFIVLKKHFKEVKRNYKSDLYPYACDFYIEDIDLYIELNLHWTHGFNMFTKKKKKDKQYKNLLKKIKKSNYYKQALYVWTDLDVRKRLTAYKNNLNFLEIFSFKNEKDIFNQINRILNGLRISYSTEETEKELKNIYNFKDIDYNKKTSNKIILMNQPSFFKQENEIFQYDLLIENRIQYLNKKEHELTDHELIRGFKVSGLYYSFSHFNPFWIRSFIQEFNIKSIYDPCGGWGHRLLGSLGIDYIYNDINLNTFKGVKNIVNFIEKYITISKIKLYNENAVSFKPKEFYECVFTCPPYYNKEIYSEDTIFENYDDYLCWWKEVIKTANHKDLKYFCFVITDEYKNDLISKFNKFRLKKEINLFVNKSHFKRKYNEYLIIMEKL